MSAFGICLLTVLSIVAVAAPVSAIPPPAQWGAAMPLASSSSAISPDIAFNANGVGFVVFLMYDPTTAHTYAARYTADGGWETAERLDITGGGGEASAPHVAVDDAGNAVAIWLKNDGSRNNMWGARFAPGVGWGPDEVLETDNGGWVDEGDIAMDGAGNAIAIWDQWNGTTYTIIENRFVVGSGWEGPGLVSPGSPSAAYGCKVSVARDGRAVVVWQQDDSGEQSIYAATYDPAVGWSTAATIESDPNYAESPTISGDGNGWFFVAWTQNNGTRNVLNATGFDFVMGWSAPYTVTGIPGLDVYNPTVAVNRPGDALLAFLVWDPFGGGWSGVYYVYAIGWRAMTGWDASPTAVSNETQNSTSDVRVALDDWGHGAVVYDRESLGWLSRTDVWAAAWDSVQGFYPAQRVETTNGGWAHSPDVASDGMGKFAAAFQVETSPSHIWVNWLTWADRSAPPIMIDSPMDAAVFDMSPIRAMGTTEPGSHLVVNGLNVAVDAVGAWWVDLPLTPGNNSIHAASMDDAGNMNEYEVVVWYTDPATYIEANLSATRAQLAQTQNQLAGTQNQLTAAYNALNATKTDLSNTKGSLNATQTNLTTTRSDLNTANTNVASAQSSASLGMALGAIGLIVGLLGVVMAMQAMKKAAGGSPPPSSPPPAQPPK